MFSLAWKNQGFNKINTTYFDKVCHNIGNKKLLFFQKMFYTY